MTEHSADTVELKPCPFCGGKSSISRDHCLDGGGVFLCVKCHKCGAKSGEKYHSHGNDCPQTYQEVRDLWNTRSAMPQQEVTVKALVWDETYKDSAKAGPFERVNYVITKWHTGEFELSLSYPGYQTGCGDIPHQPTMEAAKAHAQAHYEATILSALSGQDAEGET